MSAVLDEAHLQSWVGMTMRSGDLVPHANHWCLLQPTVPMHEIGDDGHPARICWPMPSGIEIRKNPPR